MHDPIIGILSRSCMIALSILQDHSVSIAVCIILYLLILVPLAISVTREGLLITLLDDELGKDEDEDIVPITLLKSQFSYLMDILVQFGHILEYTALLTGFSIFLNKLKEENTLFNRRRKSFSFLTYLCFTASTSLHWGLSLAPPSYAIKWKEIIIPSYDNNTVIALTYGALTMLSHFFNAVIGSALIIATVIVIHLWRSQSCFSQSERRCMPTSKLRAQMIDSGHLQIILPSNLLHVTISKSAGRSAENLLFDVQSEPCGHLKITLQEGLPPSLKTIVLLPKPTCTNEFQALNNNYEKIGKQVSAVQTIFEGWFVAHWVTYIFRITMDTTNIVKSVTTNNYVNENVQIRFIVIHWFYDFFNLMLTYICGQLMNYYHKKYHEELKKSQKALLSGQKGFLLQYVNLIPKRHGYQFLPSFCGFSIPLDNLGYLLTILMALLALIVTLTIDFLQP